jgi:hypothetical protein
MGVLPAMHFIYTIKRLLSKKVIKNVEIIFLFLLLFIPSLRVIFKFLPHPVLVSIIIGMLLFLFYHLLFSDKAQGYFSRHQKLIKRLIPFIIVLFIASNYRIYPVLDAYRNVGRGSTADDAVILSINNLVTEGHFYAKTLPGAIPISPGPGWLLLNALFVLCRCYFLLTPFYVAGMIWIYMRLYKNGIVPLLVLLLLSSSPVFWELMFTGNDLIAVGCSFAIIVMLLYHYSVQTDVRIISLPLIILAVLIGCVATSRVVFIYFPLLVRILIGKIKPAKSLFIFAVSLTAALALHIVFYLTCEHYQPLHLYSRGITNVGLPLIIVGVVGAAGILTAIVKIEVRPSLESFLQWVFVLMAIPLLLISLGEFLHFESSISRWEGANYFMPVIPLYVLYFSSKYAVTRQLGAGT